MPWKRGSGMSDRRPRSEQRIVADGDHRNHRTRPYRRVAIGERMTERAAEREHRDRRGREVDDLPDRQSPVAATLRRARRTIRLQSGGPKLGREPPHPLAELCAIATPREMTCEQARLDLGELAVDLQRDQDVRTFTCLSRLGHDGYDDEIAEKSGTARRVLTAAGRVGAVRCRRRRRHDPASRSAPVSSASARAGSDMPPSVPDRARSPSGSPRHTHRSVPAGSVDGTGSRSAG